MAVLGNIGTGGARHSVRAVGVDEKAWLATAAGKGLPALPTHVPMLSLTAILLLVSLKP